MKSGVARFCRTCQMVGKQNHLVPPVPLQPIPAIGEPFERVFVDCVGPLPRSKAGNQFLSVNTRFPEAFPLCRITASSVSLTRLQLLVSQRWCRPTKEPIFFQEFLNKLSAIGVTHSMSSASRTVASNIEIDAKKVLL